MSRTKRDFPTLREREADRSLTSNRSHIFTAFSSSTNTDIDLGGRIPASMTIANTSATVAPTVSLKAKSTSGGTDFIILANIDLPVGTTLRLDAEDISIPDTNYDLNVIVAAIGTPAVVVVTRF